MNSTSITAKLDGRDLLELSRDGGRVTLRVIGCDALLQLVKLLKQQHGDDPSKWPEPAGHSHSEMLVRELILKARGEWKPPYEHEELCHCRMIPTEVVDQAIVAGAHAPEIVSRWTSASTACGTCRPDVEKMIAYRLGKKA